MRPLSLQTFGSQTEKLERVHPSWTEYLEGGFFGTPVQCQDCHLLLSKVAKMTLIFCSCVLLTFLTQNGSVNICRWLIYAGQGAVRLYWLFLQIKASATFGLKHRMGGERTKASLKAF